ncbi:outer membrane beta-barrel protein [Erwinia sp. S63]|uniref:Ail/Lom family outer membrane beta-barrel protein n=1 Tax=Erwinia sp. S63 TaxID=2769341 RepID=UPI00190D733A|nr:Ail/Lom family outer membrane beta-barrel protein [Erwinia sp. S63]MBK0099603.1 outer membrane beta-barrel protein [Erwinia sp. S63]
MMARRKAITLALAALFLSSAALAKSPDTSHDLFNPSLYLGYEHAKIKDYGNLHGPNFSFHLETDYPVGLMGSLTAMKNDWDRHDRNGKPDQFGHTPPPKSNAEYYSAMIGPTTKLNKVVSLYALAGVSHTRVKLVKDGAIKSSASSNQFAWGAGILAHLTDNLALKVGYEGSKASFNGKDHPLSGLVANLGYRF